MEGRAKLEDIVCGSGGARRPAAGDHADVLRYARLTRPLRLQQEGLELLCGFLRRLVADLRRLRRLRCTGGQLCHGCAALGALGFRGLGWLGAGAGQLACRWQACPVSPATPHLPRRSLCSQRSTAGAGPTIWAP